MPNAGSSWGTTQPYIPVIPAGQRAKLPGSPILFASQTELEAAVTAERGNIDIAAIWMQGQELRVATEGAAVRLWTLGVDAASSHARLVQLPSGVTLTLGSDTSQVRLTAGAPSAGLGANGDIAFDSATGTAYSKAAGAWTVAAQPPASGGATNITVTAGAADIALGSSTGTGATVPAATTTLAGVMLPGEKTKLAGVAPGATANATDAQLRDRATHTGTQPATSITGLATVATSGAYSSLTGLPTLGTAAAMASTAFAPASGIAKTALATAVQASLDKADTALQTAPVTTVAGRTGAVVLAKADVGLTNVDNTSDAAKPVSTATQTALNAKQNTLVSGTSIKTINGQSVLGSGDIAIAGGAGATNITVTANAADLTIASSSGTAGTLPAASATLAGAMLPAEKTKLSGVATGATANATDAQLRDRSTHTGTQPFSTLTGLPSTLAGHGITDAAPSSHVGATGAAHGAATTAVAGFMSSADKTKLDGVAAGATANATDANLRDRATHTGTQAFSTLTGLPTTLAGHGITDGVNTTHLGAVGGAHGVATTSVNGFMAAADKTKLDGIAAGATANATDAQLRDRSTHTGTQAFSTITGRPTTLAGYGITDAAPASGIAKTALATAVQASLDKADTALQALPALKTVGGQTITGSGDIPLAAAVMIPGALYVSASAGNDATAVAGDISKPFASVRTAVDAATAGQYIVLLPGTHTGLAPLVLKHGCTLTSLLGRGATILNFSGDFPMQGGTGPATHGGQIQPSPGVVGVDACYVRDLTIRLGMNATGTYATVTGVNTATGMAITGTNASFADMFVDDCDVTGVSDCHIAVDARQRTTYSNSVLRSSFDFCHLIGPSNSAFMTLNNCKLIYQPWFDEVTLNGPPISGCVRVRSGTLTLNNCSLDIYNDGRVAGWTVADTDAWSGLVVDDFPGATIVVNGGLPVTNRGAAWPGPMIARFGSGVAIGTPSRGAVIVDGTVPGLAAHNHTAPLAGGGPSPVRIIPRSDMVVAATLFAGAKSTSRNNTYRASATATTQTYHLACLPPGAVVKGVRLDRRVVYGGGAGTATTIEVGIVGNTTKYLPATDLRVLGATATALNIVEGSGDPLAGTGTLVVVTLRNTGANCSTLTGGEAVIGLELGAIAP